MLLSVVYFGSQRVAVRTSAGVTYLHGNHLGSTSVTSGAQTSKQWYYAYGGVRATEGTLPTDYTFTGQKADSYIRLLYLCASPSIRFQQIPFQGTPHLEPNIVGIPVRAATSTTR